MERDKLYKLLGAEKPTTEINTLRDYCKDLVKMSRDEMQKYYSTWDAADRVYRGQRAEDRQDKKAKSRGEPVKMIVPLTYQQVQTFVAFAYTVLTQRDYFYELSGSGTEDEQAAKLQQALLERDLEYNKFKTEKLTQILTDVARYGIGIVKSGWVKETTPIVEEVVVEEQSPDPTLPVTPRTQKQVRDVTKFLGNKVTVVSPYKFFPDPRLPLTRFQEGEFCGSEDEYSKSDLNALQRQGQVAGIEHVQALTKEDGDGRRLLWVQAESATNGSDDKFQLITEVQFLLNPSETKITETEMLDKDVDRDIKYLVWIANDQRIVRLEPMGYAHDEFTYDVGQFANDQTKFINEGLVEVLGPLQDTITWFINARITSVRKVISNFLLVDPDAIEIKDLNERSPVIRLKKKYAGSGLDNYVKQLKVEDVTKSHLDDVAILTGYARDATGISENLMGQFSSGRRSATEARNVSSNAAGRQLLVVNGLWDTIFQPLGRKMSSNHQQGLDEEQLIKVAGLSNVMANQQGAIQMLNITKDQLIGNYDFIMFEGSLPSQRHANAGTLQELLIAMMSNPMAIPLLGLDPKLLTLEALTLRDIRNVDRFNLTPERLGELTGMAGQPPNPADPNGAPPVG